MLNFLSEKIGHKYKRFARKLNIDDVAIDNIEHSPHCDIMQEKCLQVFEKLLTMKSRVEWNQVKQALESFHQTKIISEFISEYPNFP